MMFEGVATRWPQLGSKRVCVSCAARFYDMTKAPPVCPKCGAVQPPETPRWRAPTGEARRSFKMREPAPFPAEEAPEPVDETETDEDAERVDASGGDEADEEDASDGRSTY